MSIESVENDIRYAGMQIARYQAQIEKLRQDIKKLECLEIEYSSISREFQQRSQESLHTVRNMMQTTDTLRLVKSYGESMQRLYTGGEYQQAVEGFDEARRVVVKKAVELENEIHTLEAAVCRYEEQMYKSQTELAQLRVREAEKNGD